MYLVMSVMTLSYEHFREQRIDPSLYKRMHVTLVYFCRHPQTLVLKLMIFVSARYLTFFFFD